MPGQPELLQAALQLHRAGHLEPAEVMCRQVLQADPQQPDALHLLGLLALDTGRFELAFESISQALELDSNRPAFHLDLGHVYRAIGKHAEAKACFERARDLDPSSALALINLGISFMEQQALVEAEAYYRAALRLEPGFGVAWNNLANVLMTKGQLDEARSCLEEAVRLNQSYAVAHNGLGTVWQRLGDLSKAQASFERAIALKPDYANAHFNLGVVLQSGGNFDRAQSCFHQAVRLKPQFVEAYYQWASVLKQGERWAEAQTCLEHALRLRPEFVPALAMLASVLEFQGKHAEARDALARAMAIQPSDELQIRLALVLPVINDSQAEIDQQRSRLQDELHRLAGQGLTLSDPENHLTGAPFFLAYQGGNDRGLMETLAGIYARAATQLEFMAPHCKPGTRYPSSGQTIRVGFVSRFFGRHTIGKLNAGFIRNLSRRDFRVLLFRFPGPDDSMSEAIQQSADEVVVLPRELNAARQLIASQRLDVLFYTDIGMDPFSYFLAFARLAPVQCVTWGHPSTTGIPTMDYFVTCTLIEPPDAQEHYTEQLVQLAHVNTCYEEPRLFAPLKSRQDFGLPDKSHLYVCTQSLYKIHPDFDSVLLGILREDPSGVVVLLSGPQPHWHGLLVKRLSRSIPDECRRIHFLPQLTQSDFLHLQASADVLLDTFPFGGGNTSLEAFAFGTPIVTMAGPLMRGRITSACYRQMGLTDCIASSPDEYVQMALRLGCDPQWRQEIKTQILERKHLLYDSVSAVRELEQFFLLAVERARRPEHTNRNDLHGSI